VDAPLAASLARSDILVAGRHGQIATALGGALPAAGLGATLMGRADCDIADAEAVRRTLADVRPALVINAAAYTAVDKAEDDAETAFATNRDGALNLALATAEWTRPRTMRRRPLRPIATARSIWREPPRKPEFR
jgi:dTDP-4-dehydrorhamnose reductase